MAKAISIIGPQGSGKSTQIRALEKRGYRPVTMSKVIATRMDSDKGFQRLCTRYMSRGKLVPTRFVMPVLWPHLAELNKRAQSEGAELLVVFDGVPRTDEQAKMLEDHLSTQDYTRAYVFLDMEIKVAHKRIRDRVAQMLARNEKPRQDDLDDGAVHERLTTYYSQLPLLKAYLNRVQAPSFTVDATLDVDQVTSKILECTTAVLCA